MTQAQALVPSLIGRRENTLSLNLLYVALGVVLISVLAQVAIPLPFTPVPITGQTFGVLFVSLCWGRRLGALTLVSYLALGGMGLPIFAAAKSGFVFGPTMGYLLGMVVAATVVGGLADRGWTRSFSKALLAGTLGTAIIFAFGLIVLSAFIPANSLLQMGLIPFLPGAVIKIALAAGLSQQMQKRLS